MNSVGGRGGRVFVDIENKKTIKLPAVALRLEKLAQTPRDSQKESSNLEQRLLDAEVRREIEIEAIRYKAAQCSQPRGTPRSVKDDDIKKSLSEKLEGAAERREAALSAKKAKAAEFGSQRKSPASTPTEKNSTDEHFDLVPKLSLHEKLQNASARKAAKINKRVEAAAALGSDRIKSAAVTRLKAEAMEESARSDLKWALDISMSESSRRKQEQLEAIVNKASRSGGSQKLASIAHRLKAEESEKAHALALKLERATRLKEEHDRAAVERATASSSTKIKKAKCFREANDVGRKNALKESLLNKEDKAVQRREMETLDKVVKAASLGTEALTHATAKRASQDYALRLAKQNRLETKLEAHAKRYEKTMKKVIEKAAKQNERVTDAKEHRALQSFIQNNDAPRQSHHSANAPLTPDDKAKAAERRRAVSCDTKVAVASQLGSTRVKTVIERKINFDQAEKKQRKQALELKMEAAASRHAEHLESTRRGLNGKRNPHAHLPPRRTPKPVVIQDTDSSIGNEHINEDQHFPYTTLGLGAFVTVLGACLARFSS